jgi:DNA-binding response OmpR family regulator
MSPKKTVVVVEDDPEARLLMSRLLTRLGYEVLPAGDGETALALVRDHKPDLICLDLGLPHVSGFDVCEAVRADGDTAHIPVLVMTGRQAPQDRALAEMLGADGYLTKPFRGAVFTDLVERLVHRAHIPTPVRPEAQR